MSEEFRLLTSEETEALIIRAQNGDLGSKDELLAGNYPLIKSIVKRYMNKGVEYDDLYQLGSMGFVKAINNYDPKFEVKFSTYAVPMIAGEIKRFLRDDGMVKVSRSVKTLSMKINAYIDEKRKQKNETPTTAELAKVFEVSEQDIVFAMDSYMCTLSLYSSSDDEDNSTNLLDRLSSPENEESTIEKLALKDAIRDLDEREKKIIMLRYFRGKTQTEIAHLLGVSQVQISRIETKILEKLKTKM